eukprot:4508041-Prymnesium_polylepis.1
MSPMPAAAGPAAPGRARVPVPSARRPHAIATTAHSRHRHPAPPRPRPPASARPRAARRSPVAAPPGGDAGGVGTAC